MKKINLLFAALCVAAFCLQSCNDNKTYAERVEEQTDAINSWIASHGYEIISEKQFYSQDTTTTENQFVLFEDNGVYMNIVEKGEGESTLKDGSYSILSRYFEIAVQSQDEMFAVGDTLSGNIALQNYPAFNMYNSGWSLPDHMLRPDEYRLTIDNSSYSASFLSGMMSMVYANAGYDQISVPTGWLVPLKYIKPTRTTSSEKVARVRLIVPHEQGTSLASYYVYPCYYEITYNLGK